MKRTVIRFGSFLVAAAILAGFFGSLLHPAFAINLADEKARAERELARAQAAADAKAAHLQDVSKSIIVTNSTIAETQSHITKVEADMERKQAEINGLEADLTRNKEVLGKLILEAYYDDGTTVLPELLSEDDLFAALNNPDRYQTMSGKMQEVLAHLQDVRDAAASAKADLEQTKQEKRDLLAQKQYQKQHLVADQQNTQSDLQDIQASISDLKGKLSELQNELNGLLGKSYSTDDVWSAVKFASKQTGVPKGVLMGFLGTETKFAANVGSGTYKKDMNPSQRSTFESICKDLGINPSKQPVSKRVCYNPKAKDGCGGWGGAMGVAQFIPTTWMGYADSVSAITGNSPASPWSLADGVTAMALKLKKTPGITGGSKSAVKSAACSYLGACSTSYINSVYYWMDNYQQVLN